MADLLIETDLVLTRLQFKIAGLKTLCAMDDYPNGGDFEADNLPAVFVGDAGDMFKSNSRHDFNYLKDPFVFVSVIVERKNGAYNQSKAILNAVKNAILYDEVCVTQWQPEGLQYPFTLSSERPPAIYFNTFVMRNLIFTSQQKQS